jgi:hypothetical protein
MVSMECVGGECVRNVVKKFSDRSIIAISVEVQKLGFAAEDVDPCKVLSN